jgi:hypothetical protein
MTQPTRAVTGNAASGLGAATPAQPPKMSDEQLRLECAKLAVQAHVQPALLVETANKIYDFVKSGAV